MKNNDHSEANPEVITIQEGHTEDKKTIDDVDVKCTKIKAQ